MILHLYRFLTVLTLVLLSGCAGPKTVTSSSPASFAPASDRIVVLISVDGLASYYMNDPKAHMPTIHRLAREGAVADSMKCAMPSVTWPCHTALATGVWPGRNGVIGNSYWDRLDNKSVPLIPDPIFDKDQIVRVPTLYDVIHNAKLRTAGICWPASRNAKTFDWTVPDMFPNDLFQKFSTPSLLEEFRAENIPFEMQETWCKAPAGGVQRDWMYARMTGHIIKKHRPNLLMLHLMETDHVQHGHGPCTPDSYWACSHEDDRVRDVWEALQAEFPGKATLFVVSDHGFNAVRQNIQPNVKLRELGLLKVENGKITERQATALSQGGSTFIYVFDKSRRAEILKQLAAEFRKVEGIEDVIEEKDFAGHGMTTVDKDPRMADLVLTAKVGYSFGDNATSKDVVTAPSEKLSGTHGYNPAQPTMHSMCVAWGAGIKPGTKLGEIRAVDIAPTIAHLLGVGMKDVDGKVLQEMLAER